ncbi:NIPSNAP-domain-containing protein [Lipomyces oligophaga]|uniref:NIPSNAP-domain-containing protein n=1 Tax=Lipomyces oligophaga TaxID=45792 RepID=UPI0034CD788D
MSLNFLKTSSKPMSSAFVRKFHNSAALLSVPKESKRVPSLANIPPSYKGHYFTEDSITEPDAQRQSTDSDSFAKQSLIKSFLFGSADLKREQESLERSISSQLMRGKYVHEITYHHVKPGSSPEYVQLVSEAYPQIAADPLNKVKLVGSWRVVVGDQDTFITIWEYNGYAGYHETNYRIHNDPAFVGYLSQLRPMLRSRVNNIVQEFSFWGGTAVPHNLGGLFELRSYDLQPGRLLEWESSWKRGIEHRRKVMEPVGAWFSQLGDLNKVFHLWQFADLEHRRISRDKCWDLKGWADTVHETVPLINKMESNILVPLPFSPLK